MQLFGSCLEKRMAVHGGALTFLYHPYARPCLAGRFGADCAAASASISAADAASLYKAMFHEDRKGCNSAGSIVLSADSTAKLGGGVRHRPLPLRLDYNEVTIHRRR